MKRSEMIKIIASNIIISELGFPSFSRAQQIAEDVLKRIEEEGMSPPSYFIDDGDIGSHFKEAWELETPLEMIILCGLPGSGKSTFAQEQLGFNIINQDIIGNRDKCIKKTKQLLNEEKSVIIDRTNINKKQRAHWINIAKEFNINQIKCVEFKISPELSIERISKRKNHPTIKEETSIHKIEEIVRRFINEYEEPCFSEGFNTINTISVDNLCKANTCS